MLATALDPRGGSCSQHDLTRFTPSHRDPIFRVSARGGETRPVTEIDFSRRENSHLMASIPSGRSALHLLYTLRR